MEASLKARLITASIGVPIIVLILFAPAPVIAAVMMLASFVGLYEYYKAVGLSEHPVLCALGYIAAAVISLGGKLPPSAALALVYGYILILFVLMLFSHRNITVVQLGLLIFGLFYIPYFLSHVVYIRTMHFGRFYIWLVFIGAFLTDTCAYFAGCLLGKHKLCPTISPKKTVEGAIGGVIGGGASCVIFGIIVNMFFGGYLGGKHMSLLLLFLLGIIAAVASEIGDLVASAIKRQFNIKDFGTILPGHGGILDRCDSIILVAPTVFLFLLNVNILVG